MASRSDKAPSAKRARVRETAPTIEEEVDAILTSTRAAVETGAEPPATADPSDFLALARLKAVFADSPDLRLLPMPKNVHAALGLKPPGVVSLMEVAHNALTKPATERYTGAEVRDLRETHTERDFPAFYTGPAFPHMLPEGGARVINHSLTDLAEHGGVREDDDEAMAGAGVSGATIVPASAGGPRSFSTLGAAAGAGAF